MHRFALFLVILPVAPTLAEEPGLKAPTGFSVSVYSDQKLANDIYCLHIDGQGRVVVGGRGYVRQLVGTGSAERAIDLVAGLNGGPMGLLWEGETLYVTADGGLKKYKGVNGLSPAKYPEVVLAMKASGEHEAHAVRRGSDGKLYFLCGNTAGVNTKTITASDSPIREPVAGVLLRFDTDEKKIECLADGFRNAYDFDFAVNGEPYTFDSDNERCVGLPWYEFCRFYRVIPGGHYGWMNPQFGQTWRKPPYYFDVVPPAATLGRGSPTGVACYRHTAFPEKYHGGFFLADWTFGKVWFVPLHGTVAGKPEPFLEASGEHGFAPTGLAVHPQTGELFVSSGGRGTRGVVYRIAPGKPTAAAKPIPMVQAPPAKPRSATDSPLDKLRSLQIELGDWIDPKVTGTVWEGYTFRKPVSAEMASALCSRLRLDFPSDNAELDRELSRTLAALGDSDDRTVEKMAAKLGPKTPVVDEIHYLIVLARLNGRRLPATSQTIVETLIGLDRKFEKEKLTRDRNWPLRLTETATMLCQKDNSLAGRLFGHPEFGRADHAWMTKLPGMNQKILARKFIANSEINPDFQWNSDSLSTLLDLPAEELWPLIPKLSLQGVSEDALIPLIAKFPRNVETPRLIAGLGSASPETILQAVQGLTKQVRPPMDAEIVALVKALRRLGDDKATAKHREHVLGLLQLRSKQNFGANVKEWEDWLAKEKPELLKQLTTTAGYDPEAWKKRLSGIAWDKGDAAAGRKAFQKATCAACHDGVQAAGPPLSGIAKRFNREDLLTAVLDPNKDVSTRYRMVRVATNDGKVYDGLVIYEAVDGVILLTGADVSVRISGDRIESTKPQSASLMPAGLLDKLTDAEIADLFAYLKGI